MRGLNSLLGLGLLFASLVADNTCFGQITCEISELFTCSHFENTTSYCSTTGCVEFEGADTCPFATIEVQPINQTTLVSGLRPVELGETGSVQYSATPIVCAEQRPCNGCDPLFSACESSGDWQVYRTYYRHSPIGDPCPDAIGIP